MSTSAGGWRRPGSRLAASPKKRKKNEVFFQRWFSDPRIRDLVDEDHTMRNVWFSGTNRGSMLTKNLLRAQEGAHEDRSLVSDLKEKLRRERPGEDFSDDGCFFICKSEKVKRSSQESNHTFLIVYCPPEDEIHVILSPSDENSQKWELRVRLNDHIRDLKKSIMDQLAERGICFPEDDLCFSFQQTAGSRLTLDDSNKICDLPGAKGGSRINLDVSLRSGGLLTLPRPKDPAPASPKNVVVAIVFLDLENKRRWSIKCCPEFIKNFLAPFKKERNEKKSVDECYAEFLDELAKRGSGGRDYVSFRQFKDCARSFSPDLRFSETWENIIAPTGIVHQRLGARLLACLNFSLSAGDETETAAKAFFHGRTKDDLNVSDPESAVKHKTRDDLNVYDPKIFFG